MDALAWMRVAVIRCPHRALLSAAAATVAVSALALTQSGAGGPIAVSLRANLATTLDPANVAAEIRLEQQIASLPGVRAVSGPGTFLEQQMRDRDRLIQRDLVGLRARHVHRALAMLLVRLGYEGVPSVGNASFVGQVVYGSGTAPKPSLRWLFPDTDHALVIAHLREGLSGARTTALDHRISQFVVDAQLEGVASHVSVGLP